MKKNAFLVLLVTVCFTSCVSLPPKASLSVEDKTKIFSVDCDLNKAELKEKTLAFLSEYFVSSKAVIQSSEGDLITGNYSAEIGKFDKYPVSCHLSFILKFSNKKANCKMIYNKMTTFIAYTDSDLNEYEGSYREGLIAEYANFEEQYDEYLKKNIF
jgi:hypothetical protein